MLADPNALATCMGYQVARGSNQRYTLANLGTIKKQLYMH
jgi:hypothetical protein